MKIWCISDTHNEHNELEIPNNVDMVICAGDAGTCRNPALNEAPLKDFFNWYKNLPIKYKVYSAGNHDTSIDTGLILRGDIPEEIIYLEHELKEISGLNVFGSPYTPSFGHGWGFNVPRNKLKPYWDEIPSNTDILITHGPPKGILDFTITTNESVGCEFLYEKIMEIQPKYHIFGHIHEDGGKTKKIDNCNTEFINASVLNLYYRKSNNGVIIEI